MDGLIGVPVRFLVEVTKASDLAKGMGDAWGQVTNRSLRKKPLECYSSGLGTDGRFVVARLTTSSSKR